MPDILCTVEMSAVELAEVVAISELVGKSPSEVVRMAVKKFSRKCVPTQKRESDSSAV